MSTVSISPENISPERIRQNELFATLPPEWPYDLLPAIRQQVQKAGRSLVVLDDDPTGTQTVYDVPVLTTWTPDALQTQFVAGTPVFYILTNSRSLPLEQAQALNREIAQNLSLASENADRPFTVVSRSDSTLRGHYPGEVDALLAALGQMVDAQLIIPYFLEGGRYTINDVHYVAEYVAGETWLIPASETPFAQDAAFGYQNSNLRQWVAEKTAETVTAESVVSLTLEDIREGGPDRITQQLLTLHSGTVCVVNAVTLRDLEVVVQAILQAEDAGQQFLYRTAASFVQVRAGLASKPLLNLADLALKDQRGGLIVVGSYVPKSTAQLEHLLASKQVVPVELDVAALLDDIRQPATIDAVTRRVDQLLAQGESVVLYTSRQLITGADGEDSLKIGQRVSSSLVEVVQSIQTSPAYLIAKGGITSSDVATQGLGIKQATVLGQVSPGIPVWQAGQESRFPQMPYVVFPGNVGGDDTLSRIISEVL